MAVFASRAWLLGCRRYQLIVSLAIVDHGLESTCADMDRSSAGVQVVPVDSEYLREHHQMLREFANATLWPKHLLVHYTWKHNNPINTNAGLYLIFILGESLHWQAIRMLMIQAGCMRASPFGWARLIETFALHWSSRSAAVGCLNEGHRSSQLHFQLSLMVYVFWALPLPASVILLLA